MRKIIIIAVILALPCSAFAAAPVIYFSDMEDAPTTGWEGSATQGAAVSIWGRNFGASGTVTVGGQVLSSATSTQVAEWAATTNPTVPLGMQRITFYLNSDMTTTTGTAANTTIKVTVNGVDSNTIPFLTRPLGSNHIYYVDDSKSDSNDGLTAANAKQTTAWARSALTAGDIVYLKAGTYNRHDTNAYCNGSCNAYHAGGLFSFGSDGSGPDHNNGTVGKSITVTAYPGDNVILDGSTGTDGNIQTLTAALTMYYCASDTINYWTFSKFTMKGLWAAVSLAYAPGVSGGTEELRIIGNDMTTISSCTSQWGNIVTHYGMSTGADGFYMYGNYLHDACSNTHGQISYQCGHEGEPEFARRIYNVYVGGYGTLDHIYFGWNEFGYNINGRGFQIYGHLTTDTLDNLYVHDNWFHDHVRQNAIFGGGDAEISENYVFLQHAWIWNNIFAQPDPGDTAVQLGGVGWGAGSVATYFFNNILEKQTTSSQPVIQITTGTHTVQNNIFVNPANTFSFYSCTGVDCNAGCTTGASCPTVTADHNLYFTRSGAPANSVPAFDSSTLTNDDPLFTASTPTTYSHYFPQETAPSINSGVTVTSVTTDFYGATRSSYDIGAYEYVAGGADTTPPSISNGAPSGVLSYGTTSTTMSLSTSETATCKYNTTDVAYASMSDTFSSTNSTSHSQILTGLTNGSSYLYYVRCIDAAANANTSSTAISWSVAINAIGRKMQGGVLRN